MPLSALGSILTTLDAGTVHTYSIKVAIEVMAAEHLMPVANDPCNNVLICMHG